MNRVGKSPVLVNSSPVGSAVATTSRDSCGGGDSDVGGAEGRTPTPPVGHTQQISHAQPVGHAPRSPYDDEFTLNAINNATLPYFRNSQHKGSPDTNSISNTNFPKSVSSWGPLHKPVHWKVRVFGDWIPCMIIHFISFDYLIRTKQEATLKFIIEFRIANWHSKQLTFENKNILYI